MCTAFSYADSRVDGTDQARKSKRDSTKQRQRRSPILCDKKSKPLRGLIILYWENTYDPIPVPIPPKRCIQTGDVYIALYHEPVIRDHHGTDRTQDNSVASHECQETDGMRKDFPGTDGPPADDGTDDLPSANVNVLDWEKTRFH